MATAHLGGWIVEIPPNLPEVFDALFVAPYTTHRWASRRGRPHWIDLEGWQDAMAGPLSAIVRTGGCEYVYSRDDEYFAGVSDPPSLRARLLKWHARLAAGAEQFAPATADEATDLAFMGSLVGRMRELIEQAFAVEQARWQAARPT